MVFRRISSLKELPEMKLTVNTGRKPMTYEESIEAADLSSFDTSENSENMGSPKHKMEQRLSEIEITADEDEEDCESEIEERALILLGWDLSTTLTQALTNLSMSQINYPAKVLFKSAMPVITMFLGLYIFLMSGDQSTPQWTPYGLILVTCSLFGAHCSAALTTCCGALIAGVTFTARKAITLVLSFALFPNRNILTYEHIYGAIIFLAGLIIRSFLKNDNVNKFSGKLKANDVS
eukprot:gene7332-14961_t